MRKINQATNSMLFLQSTPVIVKTLCSCLENKSNMFYNCKQCFGAKIKTTVHIKSLAVVFIVCFQIIVAAAKFNLFFKIIQNILIFFHADSKFKCVLKI